MAETNAQIYARHRPRYPENLIEDLRRRTIGNHAELLIDWGCGTGELTLPLSVNFDRVRAIDVAEERIAIAEESARAGGIGNVEWRVGKAEDLEIAPESCDLITSASAFHWMDRELLSERAFAGLRQDGAVAITGGAGDDIWSGGKEWHRVAVDCLGRHLDQSPPEEKHAGSANDSRPARESTPPRDAKPTQDAKPAQDPKPPKKSHGDFLAAAGFEVDCLPYPTEFAWPIDEVAGYMYSITGGLPWNLGDERAAFERDFRETLASLNPSGVVNDTINFFLFIAKKPPGA